MALVEPQQLVRLLLAQAAVAVVGLSTAQHRKQLLALVELAALAALALAAEVLLDTSPLPQQ